MVSLAGTVLALFAASLMVGNTFYGPGEVLRVFLGRPTAGAAFTVGELRLPRAALGLLAGACFGVAGATFQSLLRNPLASPDIIGISSGASAAAVVGIVVLSLDETAVSVLALGGALVTALVLHLLAGRGGFTGARLILVGIGLAAMLRSMVAYVLSQAAAWEMQSAMRWLAGSLNGATWLRVAPLAVASTVFLAALPAAGRTLAASLGVGVARSRLGLMLAAVVLLAFATAAAGPVAFVAFMAGPIAARLVGPGASLLPAAGLVGATLVLAADLAGPLAFAHRYPVGVVTGVLGAPYLVVLLIRSNRAGGSL